MQLTVSTSLLNLITSVKTLKGFRDIGNRGNLDERRQPPKLATHSETSAKYFFFCLNEIVYLT